MSGSFSSNLSRTLESKKKGSEINLHNSFCNENPWVHCCCWPVAASPGDGTSLVIKEEYKFVGVQINISQYHQRVGSVTAALADMSEFSTLEVFGKLCLGFICSV